jgi:hypothetical protein
MFGWQARELSRAAAAECKHKSVLLFTLAVKLVLTVTITGMHVCICALVASVKTARCHG